MRVRPRPGPPVLPDQAVRRDQALLRLRTGGGDHLDAGSLADLDPGVAAMVGLARDCGAPLAPVVAAAVDGAEHRRRVAAERTAAIAPARTVARSLVALPVLAVPALALVTGIDLVAFFLRDPLGRILLGAVVVLLVVAWLWMRAILTHAARGPRPDPPPRPWLAALVPVAWWLAGPVPAVAVAVLVAVRMRRRPSGVAPRLPLAVDLVAVAVSAGHDLPAALRLAGDRVEPFDAGLAVALRAAALDLALRPGDDPVADPPAPAATHDVLLGPLAPTVRALAHAGTPGADVLGDLADRLRADRAAAARAEVARLPARLTFPTALVLVPATVLAIGAPIVLDGLARVTGP